MAKPYLIICDRSPYGSISLRESLDMATAAAAFDMPVTLLLRGDGVYGALAAQASADLGQKNIAKQLGALTIFGVQAIHIDGTALAQRGLSPTELVDGIQVVDSAGIRGLLASAAIVVQL